MLEKQAEQVRSHSQSVVKTNLETAYRNIPEGKVAPGRIQ